MFDFSNENRIKITQIEDDFAELRSLKQRVLILKEHFFSSITRLNQLKII